MTCGGRWGVFGWKFSIVGSPMAIFLTRRWNFLFDLLCLLLIELMKLAGKIVLIFSSTSISSIYGSESDPCTS